jgi:universal stress protein A
MIKLQRILFATDFSDLAATAQEYACELAGRFGAELHVLHVLQDVMLMMPEPGSAFSLPQNYMVELKQAAEKRSKPFPRPSGVPGRKSSAPRGWELRSSKSYAMRANRKSIW